MFTAWGRPYSTGDVRACLDVVDDLHRRGIDSRRFCQQLCDHFRNLLFLAIGGHGGRILTGFAGGEILVLKNEVGKTTPESLHLIFQMVLKAEEEIRRSSLPRITLEMLLLRLSQLPRLESLGSILAKMRLAGKPPGQEQVGLAASKVGGRSP